MQIYKENKYILPEILEVVSDSVQVLNNHALDCP